MASLKEELEKLTNPTPVFNDPEDETDAARLVDKSQEFDRDDEPQDQSSLRQRAAPLLSDTDSKYAGKKVSRKSWKQDSDDDDVDEAAVAALDKAMDADSLTEDSDDDEGDDDDVSESESGEEETQLEKFKTKLNVSGSDGGYTSQEFSFVDDGDYSKYADDDDSGGTDADDDSQDDDDSAEEEDANETSTVSNFTPRQQDEDVKKGNAARAQLTLWDTLLEERIKMQKTVTVVNQLPHPDTWQRFMETGGDNLEKSTKNARSVLKSLLGDLVELQTLLLLQNPETKHIVEGTSPSNKKQLDEDDEEITSDSEKEDTATTDQKTKLKSSVLKRKLKMKDYPEFLAKRHASFKAYRDSTIEKWHDKTRLATGKVNSKSFGAFDQSVMKQVQQILSDRDRLVKRTQLKRSAYRVLGNVEKREEEIERHTAADESSEAAPTRDHLKDYDEEIFDDDDFYHQLLRELIERKTSEINDPVEVSRRWLAVQKLRNRVKKNVDRKASKGRKIRYEIHNKLVNFMAPVDRTTWSEEAKNDLFKSLFGHCFQQTEVNKDNESGDGSAER
ncbi:protein AATF-like [Gigantopelta aegis]|uniref:protein AATF-like n=1 Tax=Gigantopelta aegis TaxID=1735272 RepID=UPI001B8882A1|nr:protein AATF-like [Gigantopelta aegis]